MRPQARRLAPLVPLAGLVLLYVQSEARSLDGYATAVLSRAVSSVFLIGPAVAAWAAWRAGILRRGGVAALGPSRSAARVAARELEPIVLGGFGILGLAVAWGLLQAGRLVGAPDPRVVGTGAAVILDHAVLGYATGARAAPIVAVPAVFIALYLWMVFPQGFEPFWVRHLTGFTNTCCGLSVELDHRALIAPALIAAGPILASLLVAGEGRWLRHRLLAGLLIIALGGVAGASLVAHLGPDPVRPRSPTALVCIDGRPKVCVWPENKARVIEVAELANDIRVALKPWGIRVPELLTETEQASGPGEPQWFFGMRPMTPHELLHMVLVATLVPRPLDCFPSRRGRDEVDTLVAWLMIKAGFPRESLSERFLALDLAEVDSMLKRSKGEQLKWYEERYAALEHCVSAQDRDGRG